MDSKTNRKLDWRVLLAGAVVVFMIAAVFNIHRCDDWTGFCKDTTTEVSVEKNAKGQIQKRTEITKPQSGKTLWDVLGLAGTLAVPVLLLYLGNQFQRKQQERANEQAKAEKERANEQAELEREIASANLRDDALQAYLDRMSELLLDRNLITSNEDDPVQDVARTRTLTILRRLEKDKTRQAIVLHFLRDAEMLNFLFKNANLEKINLEGANLGKANLEGAFLLEANLERAFLVEANLERAFLIKANLERAFLIRAKLMGADLTEANLEGAKLEYAYLEGANLERAKLKGANLKQANLEYANLEGANLEGANLEGANLKQANLEGINLEEANLKQANLEYANLGGANLGDSSM